MIDRKFYPTLRQPIDKAALQAQEDHQDRCDHHDRGGTGQRPIAAETAGEVVVTGGDREEIRVIDKDQRDLKFAPHAQCRPQVPL